MNAISRHDWTVSPNHRVCAEHITQDDLIKTVIDKRKGRADA